MFWQQAENIDDSENSKTFKKPKKRLNFTFNVKIAVNVNTKLSTNKQQQRQPDQINNDTNTNTNQKNKKKKEMSGLRYQLSQLLRYGYGNGNGYGNGYGNLSILIIMNLLGLLLLTLCCDVCRSQMNFTQPQLNSDVVEKVAVWHKHAAAAPPTLTAGIAIAINRDKDKDGNGDGDLNHSIPFDNHHHILSRQGMIDDQIALEQITRDCVQRCIVEEDLFLDEFGIKCDKGDNSDKCYKTRCTKGCTQWYRALKEFEPCQEACSSMQFFPNDMPCIAACEMSQRDYWHHLRLTMTEAVEQTQPTLLTSPLVIKWSIQYSDNYFASRPFRIQYQNIDDAGDSDMNWLNLAVYDCDEYFVCEILENLMPYTKYRFRFELRFGESYEDILHSPPTVYYETPIEGLPISCPIITHLIAIDSSHVAVHWQAGRYNSGPIIGYRVTINGTTNQISSHISTDMQNYSHIFTGLQPLTNYSITITTLNAMGEGPAVISDNIITLHTSSSSSSRSVVDVDLYDDVVLIILDHSIIYQSLDDSLHESHVIYHSKEIDLIDVSYLHSEQRLWILNELGKIYSLLVMPKEEKSSSTTTPTEVQLMESEKWKPMRLSIDWIHMRLYLIVQMVDNIKNLELLSTDLHGNHVKNFDEKFISPVNHLQVDPLNGWLFWSDANGLWRLDLASRMRRILKADHPFTGHFHLDIERWMIYAMTHQPPSLNDNQLHVISYDGGNVTSYPIVMNVTSECYLYDSKTSTLLLVAQNASRIVRYNCTVGQMVITEVRQLDGKMDEREEICRSIVPISGNHYQPKALRMGIPHKLRALLGVHTAQIEWEAPPLGGYQSMAALTASNDLTYELEVLDVASHSAYNIRNIRIPNFTVERLQANNLYQVRIRGSSSGGGGGGDDGATPGPWTAPYVARTWPLGSHRLLWSTTGGRIYETDERGANLKEPFVGGHLKFAPGRMAIVNASSSYYVSGNGELHCVNLLHPDDGEREEEPRQGGTSIRHVGSVAYDWRGGRLYWTDMARDCVIRMDPVSGIRELLPIFGGREIFLDSVQGFIYYTTSTRLARCRLNGQPTATDRNDLEYYHVNGLGGHIAAFTVDLVHQYIYWMVAVVSASSTTTNTLRLYRAPLSPTTSSSQQHQQQQQQKMQLLLLQNDVTLFANTLSAVAQLDALLWLSADGRSAHLMPMTSATSATTTANPQLQLTAPSNDGDDDGKATSVQFIEHLPSIISDQSVVPKAVVADSVAIDDGYWDDFHVRWQPARTVENYTVHYKVLLEFLGTGGSGGGGVDGGIHLQALEVAAPFVRITDMHQAQLSLRISITPHTAWRAGPTTQLILATPAAAPTQPKRLRVFIERRSSALHSPNVSAIIRWDPPENGQSTSQSQSLAYRVYCWRGEQMHAEQLHNDTMGHAKHNSEGHPLQVRIDNLEPDETYTFQVQAFVNGTGTGMGTGMSMGAATAVQAVHVVPEAQAIPRVIFATAEYIGELDLDTRQRRPLVHTASAVEHLALLQGEQRLLWVNENVELMTYVPGAAPAKLARMRAEVLALTVDWVSRIVYWAELDAELPQTAGIYRLELCQFEGRILHGERLWRTPRGRLLRDLIALPHSQSLVWLEYEALHGRNATLAGRNITDNTPLTFRTPAPLWRLFEGSLEPETETLSLVDHTGRLCAYDVARQLCTALRAHFNVLNDDITELARDPGFLYALRNNSVRAYNRRRQQLEYLVDVSEVRLLRAYNYQSYPERQCLLLPSPASSAAVAGVAAAGATSVIPKPTCEETQCIVPLPALHASEQCTLPVPGLRFHVLLTHGNATTRTITGGPGTKVKIDGLEPFTDYELQLRITSYYQQRLGLSAIMQPLEPMELRTAPAVPSEPRNFTVRPLSPSALVVEWLPPLEVRRSGRIWYTLHWQQEQLASGADLRLEASVQRHLLTGLHPNSSYDVWLHVHATPTKFNQSVTLSVSTYVALPQLQLREATAYALVLTWSGTSDPLAALTLLCESPTKGQQQLQFDVLGNHTEILVDKLQPKTCYQCHLLLVYANSIADVDAPYHGEISTFETLGDRPNAPGKPHIEHIAGEIFKVSWTAAIDNGAPVLIYSMEALQARHSRRRRRRRRRRRDAHLTKLVMLPWAEEPTVVEDQWLEYCNTTELSCIVRELHTHRLVLFRVRALNSPYGWSPYSEDSERVAEPLVSPEKRGSLVLAIIAPAAIVSSCVLALVLIRKVQRHRVRRKKLLQQSRPSIWSNLSTQQQLLAARNRAFSTASHSTSLYTGGPLSDADIALLPHISWNQLTLLRFLGSGAFGEVYEGQLQYEDETQPQRVAIKSLRKGSNEFAELLQEAQLMSNFKHENIVRLVGVCLDSDSISLVMEHMEAGDLLSYLRASRPNLQSSPIQQEFSSSSSPSLPALAGASSVDALQLSELLAMCTDVATGCSYLEDMHFVHRDLACRNCLVSSMDSRKRVVKIGDFGLARDIYKSDYYRKEGEGLLPVRWMSPESLVDGVFTTQSDVWAFGVLCWEILTLGQQPYAARNNFEVLAHVKDGGRLHQPQQCPDKLYALLVQCWQTDPEDRPTFRRCVGLLHAISTNLRRTGSGSGSSPKIELKVRFDEETATATEIETAIFSSPTTITTLNGNIPPGSDNGLIYANEGISRL